MRQIGPHLFVDGAAQEALEEAIRLFILGNPSKGEEPAGLLETSISFTAPPRFGKSRIQRIAAVEAQASVRAACLEVLSPEPRPKQRTAFWRSAQHLRRRDRYKP